MSKVLDVLKSIADTQGQVIPDLLKSRRESENKFRDIQAKGLLDQIHATGADGNPVLTPEEREAAWDEVEKIYSGHKSAKGLLQKAREVSGQIFGIMPPPPQQQKQGLAQSKQIVAPLMEGNDPQGGINQPAPISTSGQPPVPDQASGGASSVLPPPPVTARSILSKGVGKRDPGDAEIARLERERDIATLKHTQDMEALSARTSSAEKIAQIRANAVKASRPVASPPLSKASATALSTQGQKFFDQSGEEIDPSSLPDDVALKPFVFTDGTGTHTFYVHMSPGQKYVTVGGRVYETGKFDPIAGGRTTPSNLGPSQIGSTSVREEAMVDAEGNPIAVPMTTVRTPAATGVQTQTNPTNSSPSGVPSPPSPARPLTPPSVAPSGGRQTPSPQGSRVLPGFTPGQFNNIQGRITPVREAANQLFGDPTQPNLKGLKDFANLSDNPEASKKLAKAVRLTFDGIEQQEKAHGNIVNLLSLYGGIPQRLVEGQVANMKDALADLSPEEMEAYNAIMSTYGTVVGLRSLTKASAAQFSIRRLEQEIPIPGWNSHSSKDFYDKMSRLAQEVYGGSRTIPESMLPEKQYMKEQVDEMLRLSKGTAIPPPPTGSRGGGSTGARGATGATGATGSTPKGRIRVIGPNGETGTMDESELSKYPGWKKAG